MYEFKKRSWRMEGGFTISRVGHAGIFVYASLWRSRGRSYQVAPGTTVQLIETLHCPLNAARKVHLMMRNSFLSFLLFAVISAGYARGGEETPLNVDGLDVLAVRTEVLIPNAEESLDRPPADAMWRSWWTSRVTAVDVYAADYVWVRVPVPSGVRGQDYLTIPANGSVDRLLADGTPVPIDVAVRYRNFYTFPAGAFRGAEWIFARIQNPSRASTPYILLGPGHLHQLYLGSLLASDFLSATVNGAEWVVHSSPEPPFDGWDDRQPDPRQLAKGDSVSLRFRVMATGGDEQALWLRNTRGESRIVVHVDGETYVDSEMPSIAPEARNANGDYAVLLPRNVESHMVTVTRTYRDFQSLTGAFDDLKFPLRSVAYAPAAALFREFGLGREQAIAANGLRYTINIALLLVAAAGLLLAFVRRGPGFSSFLWFSLMSGTVMLAMNAAIPWEPLYRMLGFLPGPPRMIPFIAVHFAPFVLVRLVRSSMVKTPSSRATLNLTIITLVLGIAYTLLYIVLIAIGAFALAENVPRFVAPVYLSALITIILCAANSRDRGIVISSAAFAVGALTTALWSSLTSGSGMGIVLIEAVNLVLVTGTIFALTGFPLTAYAASERNLLEANLVFRKFVPEEFISFLGINDITQIEVGRQIETKLTLMFCDIRSFTSISEKLTPVEVMNLINRYLATVSPIVRRHHGFVDKYMGDGVLAIFPGSSRDACWAAIEMSESVQGIPEHDIRVGIGLHRGRAMLGTIGEEGRIDTTVLSDSVNVSSRIQGRSAEFNSAVLVSAEVKDDASDDPNLSFKYIDHLNVKGREQPVETYALSRVKGTR